MPKPPVDSEIQARAVVLIKSGELSRNAIAKELGIAGSTVTRIARDEGLEFNGALSELAIRARAVDVRRMQLQLAQKLLVRADDALEALDAPFEIGHWSSQSETRDASYDTHILDAPPTSDQRNLMVIAGVSIQRANELVAKTGNSDVADGISMIRGIADAIEIAMTPKAGDPVYDEGFAPDDPDDPTVEPR